MIGAAVLTYFVVTSSLEKTKIQKSNQLLTLYQKQKNPKTLLELKKINPKLYEFVALKEAVSKKDLNLLKDLANSQSQIVSTIAKYHIASIKADTKELEKYTLQERAFLKDFALLELGYKLLKEGKIDNAKKVFNSIAYDSPLKKAASSLEHYGIK